MTKKSRILFLRTDAYFIAADDINYIISTDFSKPAFIDCSLLPFKGDAYKTMSAENACQRKVFYLRKHGSLNELADKLQIDKLTE